MPKYRIGLLHTVLEEATVYIEAFNLEEAERIALKQVDEGNVRWRFLEAHGPVGIVSADEE